MATLTPNYNLSKPDSSDQFDAFRQSYNDNMDIIDQNMGGGGGGGGHIIVDPTGADMPQENKLQFTGAVNVSDDSVNGQTVVDVEGNYYLNTLYSTEEKKVGYWTDKKPLYQKTWLVPKSSLNSGETTYTHGDNLNIDTLVSVEGAVANSRPLVEYHSSSTWACSIYNIGNNAFWIYLGSNVYSNMSASSYVKVTLRYTKTTDTPELNPQTGGVIYLPSIYSTEEREIGCWIDGKPLYQKTIEFDCANTSNVQTAYVIPNTHFIVNVCDAYFQNSTGGLSQQFRYTWYKDHFWSYIVNNSGHAISVHKETTDGNWQSGVKFFITIQYTKTTDTAGSGSWTPSGANAVHYSTNEQVIGTWVDGKPLYQKSFNLPSTITINNSSWTSTGVSISDIKNVVDGELNRNGTQKFACSFRETSSVIEIQTYFNGTQCNTDSVVTVQYTKTTD